MNPNPFPLDLEIYDVAVIYRISPNGGLAEECHIVAAVEKEDVITAVKHYYRESEILAIVFH